MNEDSNLARFGAYTKALELFDLLVADLAPISRRPGVERLIAQQIASADSIASNIEEGYGRASKKDYAHFLVISRGSAQETAGRYRRLRHWLPADTVEARFALCGEIIAILSKSIRTLRGP